MAISESKSSTSDVVEESTKISFPQALEDGEELAAVGVRKKSILGLIAVKVYAFGIYADNEKLSSFVKPKFERVPDEPSQELYDFAINGDIGMTVRLVLVFGHLNMQMVRKIFNENLGASIRKLSGTDKEELLQRVLGEVRDDKKLSMGSIIQMVRLPGFVLQTKVKDEVVSEVKSELLCRAFFNMYLGDDPLDPKAKERFGCFLISMLKR